MLQNRASLTDRVADILIGRIIDGTYAVGEKLPAGRLLAQEFGVSAAVIREATERLRTKGLVKTRQGAGCIVLADAPDEGFQLALPSTVDRASLLHIYELRVGLEGAAAALAARRTTDDDLARMAHVLAQLEASLREPERAMEWDFAFHRTLAECTHNPHYPQLLAYLSGQWRLSVEVARRHTLEADGGAVARHVAASRTERVHEEHEAIYAALRARDPQLARARTQEHLRRACERLGLDVTAAIPIPTTTGNPQ